MADETPQRPGWLDQIRDIWSDAPPERRRIAYGVLAAAVLGLAYMAWQVAVAPTWQAVARGMLPEDQQAAVTALEARQIPYRLADAGTVLVPEDRIHEARIELAAGAMPSGRAVGFELFDKSELGRSTFAERVNYHRALEGEMSRTIRHIRAIERVRVHLVLPERRLFAEDEVEPSASVVVTLKAGASLDKRQVQAIRQLVSGGVERLKTGRVSVVDQSGVVLARVADSEGITDEAMEMRTRLESSMARRVVALLEPVVGRGRVRAQVAADVDFSRLVETHETFDPEGQVIRSERERTESSLTEARVAAGPPGTATNVPDRAQAADANQPAGGVPKKQDKVDHIKNYEIDRKTTRRDSPQPRVSRLSVAVVVDSGEAEPDEEALASYRSLVAKAVGADESRGDAVAVLAMPFAPVEAALAETDATPAGMLSPIALAGLAGGVLLLALLIGLFLWMRARKRRREAEAARIEAERRAALEAEDAAPAPWEANQELQEKIAKLREDVRGASREDIRRTASVIRQWLRQDDEGAAA